MNTCNTCISCFHLAENSSGMIYCSRIPDNQYDEPFSTASKELTETVLLINEPEAFGCIYHSLNRSSFHLRVKEWIYQDLKGFRKE